MPGLKRENIFAFIDDNILSIIALKQRPRENGVMKMHEIETDFLERYILIPRSADMAFVSAEYSDGMLAFQIPKEHSGILKIVILLSFTSEPQPWLFHFNTPTR
jgi:HSP20 family molecular chaperone IbpA